MAPDGAAFSIGELPPGALQAPGGKVMELEGRRKNGEAFPLEACFSEWQGVDGLQYGAVMRDISVRKREAERIRYLAEHDTLTGLANRNKLHERLGATLAEAEAKQCEVALLMMDLDKFKQINDTLGHACGDQLLRGVAERLNALVEGAGLVARLSGDEFAIVISGANVVAQAVQAFGADIAGLHAERFYRRSTPVTRQCQHRGRAPIQRIAPRRTNCSAMPTSRCIRPRPPGAAVTSLFERRIRDELETRLALEADLALAVERDEFELFISRRSIWKTAGWSAPRR